MNEQYGNIEYRSELGGIGNKVVYGGEKLTEQVLITEEVIEEIKKCSELAPLHNPAAVLGIEACRKIVPEMKMVAVFDTAFHQTIEEDKYIYPIPYRYYEKYGIRKYGFHGTSHQYVSGRVAELIGKDIKKLKIVSCHLGQGASICAIKYGKSIETSMGLKQIGGICMGTRSGDLDLSVVSHIMKKEKLSSDEMEKILNKNSGVYGISGISVDFRDVESEANLGDKRSKLALDVFHDLVASYITKCAVAMSGIDVITFTAGVGEKGGQSRKAICNKLEFLGVKVDSKKNEETYDVEAKISANDSDIDVYVVPTNEELMIARQTLCVINSSED